MYCMLFLVIFQGWFGREGCGFWLRSWKAGLWTSTTRLGDTYGESFRLPKCRYSFFVWNGRKEGWERD
ncbi:hypothetical protein I3843_08G117800 [Carya illinoinensis]|nr:hypothetical protein I3760_08G123300 [Carya illinoinensis]KAG7967808.1 hypothetical protein I3843_08G117800 [Carya illinoinensis]